MSDLEKKIAELETLQQRQLVDLKASAHGVVASLSPANLLKSALQDIRHTPGLRKKAINAAIGLGAGYIGKKLFVGRSGNPFKKMSGAVVQFLLTNFVRQRLPTTKDN